MKDVSPQVTQVSTRLDQPVEAHEITLAGSKQAVGCSWEGELFSISPGTTCHFIIYLSQPRWWQFNNTKRLQLRLVSPGSKVEITLERTGESPQVETLENPLSALSSPGPGAQTPTPKATPTPIQLTVYDPDRQGQDWRLTLTCQRFGEENCQVELAP